MGRLCLIMFFIVLAQILVIQAMGQNMEESKPYPSFVKVQSGGENGLVDIPAAAPVAERRDAVEEGRGEETTVAEAPTYRRMGQHKSSDKSVAGGGVIIGGLVTALFAAVFCYIRVTRRRDVYDNK